jgi:hypothetical protein
MTAEKIEVVTAYIGRRNRRGFRRARFRRARFRPQCIPAPDGREREDRGRQHAQQRWWRHQLRSQGFVTLASTISRTLRASASGARGF